jgi:hypothetical protein
MHRISGGNIDKQRLRAFSLLRDLRVKSETWEISREGRKEAKEREEISGSAH